MYENMENNTKIPYLLLPHRIDSVLNIKMKQAKMLNTL